MQLGRTLAAVFVGVLVTLATTGCGATVSGGPTRVDVTLAFEVEADQPTTYPAPEGLIQRIQGATVILGSDSMSAKGGSLSISKDGAFTYTPATGFTGTDTFSFRSELASSGSTRVVFGTATLTVGTFFPKGTAAAFTGTEDTPLPGGAFAAATDPAALPLTWSVVTAPAQAQSFSLDPATGAIAYTPVPNFAGADTFQFKVTNTDGRESLPTTITLNIDPINDAPSVTVAGAQASADAKANSVAGFATFAAGGGADEAVQSAMAYAVTNDMNALFAVQPAIATDGTLTYTTAGAVLGVATVTVFVQDDGGTAGGGVDLSVAPVTFTVTVTDVNSPPVVNPAPGPYGYFGNTTLTVSVGQGLLANFTDPNDMPSNAPAAAPIVVTQQPLEGVLTVANDGSFTYVPAVGSRNDQTFSFTVQDDGGTAGGGVDTTDPITVNLPFGGIVWWVDNATAGMMLGTQADPFATIAQAEAELTRVAGDVFRIRRGTGGTTGYDTGFTLQAGDQVIGEGVALVAGIVTIDAANGMGGPTLTNSGAAAGTDSLTLDGGNTVQGLTLQSVADATAYAMRGDAAGTLTVSDVVVASAAGGVRLADLSSTAMVAFTGVSSTNGEHGIRLDNAPAGAAFSVTGAVTITNSTAEGILIQNGAMPVTFGGAVTIDDSVSLQTALSIQTHTGLVSFNGDFDVLGSQVGLDVQNSAGVAITSGGLSSPTVVATGGPALRFVNVGVGAVGTNLGFDSVTSITPANEGVHLDGVTTPVALASVTVTNPAAANAIAVRINNLMGASASFSGVTVTSAGQPVTAVQLDGGGVVPTFAMPAINLTVAGSRGLDVLTGHPGVTVTGGTIQVAGINSQAVRVVGSAGAQFLFDGVTISSAAGPGLSATGAAGDLEVRGMTTVEGNFCTPGSGLGCAVDIDMPSLNGVTFESITADGGDFGVSVRNSAKFQVAATGGNGGTLTGHLVAGMRFDTVAGVSLKDMMVQNSSADGIVVAQGSGVVLDSLTVMGNGDAAGEHGVELMDVATPVTLTSCNLLDNGENQLDIRYTASPGAQVVVGVTGGMVGNTAAPAAPRNHGILLSAATTADVTATINMIGFQNILANGVDAAFTGSPPGALGVTLTNSTFGTQGGALRFAKGGDGNGTVVASGNDIQGCTGVCLQALGTGASSGGQLNVAFTGNTIGTLAGAPPPLGSAGTGSTGAGVAGGGIAVRAQGDETAKVEISGNTVVGIAASRALDVEVSGGTGAGSMTADIRTNTAATDAATGLDALVLTASDTNTLCARVSGNTAEGDGGGVGGALDYQLSQLGASTFNLEGTNASASAEILATNNGSGGGLEFGSSGTVSIVAPASCP